MIVQLIVFHVVLEGSQNKLSLTGFFGLVRSGFKEGWIEEKKVIG